MNMLVRWITDAQSINVEEKGVSYSEEAFTQLYEEALRLDADHKVDLRFATGRGILIGATGVGLTWLGTLGYNKFKKRKLDGSKEVAVTLDELETFEQEVVEINDEGAGMPKKDMGDLAKVIMEITEHEKK